MSQATAPKVSVLGDGISTFEGYTPRLGSWYSPSYISYSGFGTPEETWWMLVTQQIGGTFLKNNSFSGSHVSYAGHYAAVLPGRIRGLATEEESPDIVLIYTGINDVIHDIELDKFRRDYLDMLQKVQKFHPGVQVWAGTLVLGQNPNNRLPYATPESLANLEDYNKIIRDCVKEAGCHLVDLAAQNITYDSVNGVHPTKEGMVTFANAWAEAIKKDL